MFKKTGIFVLTGLLLMNIYGCLAIFAGAAAGAGTAVWLSGKLTQQFDASYERTIDAADSALRSLKLGVIKESKEANVTQLRSEYSDGKNIWIDIRKVTETATKVEVRVGAVSHDKAASEKILKRIQAHL
ncbi:MAG: DUF3568 family protein [Candidatus Omnitrophica bacterium]|nr:DUF3568 family protein [Candidatus Omnitrophota bacterium]